ncbi:glycosyltransferase [Asaia platycodi]|uniref:glycosyltransferase n=1 Tax=Asaia platycodi TaxID=610243 RepID=UPI000AF5F902|nr:glycosyltransferase [Asaia platycodi]
MRVLTVLPRREGYAPDRAGAIALLVSRLATPDDIVIGTEVTGTPLPGGQFFAITEPGGLHRWRRDGTRYRIACQREIRRHKPDLIEVHNRPALANALSRCGIPVHLILHNDPQDMHGAKRPRQRQELMQRVRVFTVSFWLRRRFLEDLDDGPVTVMPNCSIFRPCPSRRQNARSLFCLPGAWCPTRAPMRLCAPGRPSAHRRRNGVRS